MGRPSEVEPQLTADTRGAIMVIGLVMGTLMVGALWNIVSIGDAIVWREHLQDGADAAAFESAVWNARGMNVIVFLNIVMSGAMAIVVALRGSIIFLTALTAALNAARAACFAPVLPLTVFLCGISFYAPTAQSLLRGATNLESRWSPRLFRFMEGVQTAQSVVATVIPAIGVRESALRTSSEYNMPAIGLSPSLLPTSTGDGPLVGGSNRVSMPRIGRGISLPVSLDGEWKLCEQAGRFVPNELLALLDQVGVPDWLLDGAGGAFRSIAGAISGSLPALFCGNQSPQDIQQLTDMFSDLARENCRAAREGGRVTDDSSHSDAQRRALQDFRDYWQPGFIASPDGTVERGYVFNTSGCERDQLNRQSMQYRANRGVRAARVWRYTKNGDFFLQAWGFSYHDAERVTANDRALDFPARGSAAGLPADTYELGTAQAEMYWDTSEGSGCDGSWDDCQPHAMWLMRWKARLRRVHDPREMAMRSLSQIAMAEVVNAMHQGIGALTRLGEGAFGNWARGRRWEQLSNFLRGNIWDTSFRNRGDIFGHNPLGWIAQETVGDRLARDPPPPNQVIIH